MYVLIFAFLDSTVYKTDVENCTVVPPSDCSELRRYTHVLTYLLVK